MGMVAANAKSSLQGGLANFGQSMLKEQGNRELFNFVAMGKGDSGALGEFSQFDLTLGDVKSHREFNIFTNGQDPRASFAAMPNSFLSPVGAYSATAAFNGLVAATLAAPGAVGTQLEGASKVQNALGIAFGAAEPAIPSGITKFGKNADKQYLEVYMQMSGSGLGNIIFITEFGGAGTNGFVGLTAG
jgi:hypothetical protein